MSISTKTTTLIILMGALLSLTALLIQRNLIYPAFHEIEIDYAQNNVDRVIQRLESARRTLDLTVYDWSAWDDTYAFIEDGNQDYIDSNLYPDTFLNFGFEVAFFLDLTKQPVWARVFDFDPDEGIIDQTDAYLEATLAATASTIDRIDLSAGVDDQHRSGVVLVKGVPLLFAVRPVLRSDGSGPHRGFVLFGQFLDPARIARFSEQIVQPFTISPVTGLARVDQQNGYQIRALDDETLSASGQYQIDGEPVLRATTIVPRNITGLGNDITLFAIGLFVLFCVVLALILLLLFRHFVVWPLTNLRVDIANISSAMDYSLRATVTSNDEIGALSKDFNRLLATIESQNNELKKRSEIDPLTGLSNRLALETKLQQAWELLGRTSAPLSVLLVDIDYFKAYNDHYGHPAGDDALKQVASILDNAIHRKTDMAARYGGEEFILVLPGTGGEAAEALARRVHEHIRAAQIEHRQSKVADHLTVSIGIASVTPNIDISVTDLIRSADNALYKAKANGRDGHVTQPVVKEDD
jgi:diguanylate cyclase (GGDEF)-like protein